MWHAGIRVIQDPVHGLMEFIRSEAFILDLLRCNELQRLRRIKQLGFACFVFPGAEHSRFAHAVGTAYLAARVGRHLSEVSRDVLPDSLHPDPCAFQDLCVAGLCHDLGHGPFSHVWERVVIGSDWDRKKWARALGVDGIEPKHFKAWHEMVTFALLTWPQGQLHTILEQTEKGRSKRVADLLTNEYFLSYIPPLLVGDIDVDRCDYVLRDAQMAGLPSCGYQLDRLIACLTFGFDDRSRIWVGLNERKGLPVAMELLNARSELHQVLYFHKTILGMEWLLGNLLKRLRDLSRMGVAIGTAEVVPDSVREMISGGVANVEGVLDLDDYAIWMLIRKIPQITGGDPTAVELARRLLERDALRAVRVESERVAEFFAYDPPTRNEAVASAVAKFVEGDPHYFFREFAVGFPLWEEEGAGKTLLVGGGSDRRIRLLSEHPDMHERFPRPTQQMGHMLFVPREARERVEELIHSH